MAAFFRQSGIAVLVSYMRSGAVQLKDTKNKFVRCAFSLRKLILNVMK